MKACAKACRCEGGLGHSGEHTSEKLQNVAGEMGWGVALFTVKETAMEGF